MLSARPALMNQQEAEEDEAELSAAHTTDGGANGYNDPPSGAGP